MFDCGAVSRLSRADPLWWEAVVDRPSYPNWQRKRIQNPSSVSSNLTEGTAAKPQADRFMGVSLSAGGTAAGWRAVSAAFRATSDFLVHDIFMTPRLNRLPCIPRTTANVLQYWMSLAADQL